MKLHELTAEYRELERLAENPEADQNQLIVWMDERKDALQEKAINIGMFVQNLDATVKAIAEAEKHMDERKRVIENRIKWIKGYLLNGMKAAEIQKIECPYFKITRKKNPPSVVIDNPDEIPVAYLRQPEPPPPAPDKKAILADMKEGVYIDGCHLVQNERIEIK
jgi:hypothetical protein